MTSVLDNYYFDKQGNPMTLTEWGEKHGDMDYKRVAFDQVGEAEVSTVWLGMNHNWDPDGSPILFETMIFHGDHGEEMWRYHTEDEAKAGHEAVVKALREGTELPS